MASGQPLGNLTNVSGSGMVTKLDHFVYKEGYKKYFLSYEMV
jgi:hypothetical protein